MRIDDVHTDVLFKDTLFSELTRDVVTAESIKISVGETHM